jgi:hypothetical protein
VRRRVPSHGRQRRRLGEEGGRLRFRRGREEGRQERADDGGAAGGLAGDERVRQRRGRRGIRLAGETTIVVPELNDEREGVFRALFSRRPPLPPPSAAGFLPSSDDPSGFFPSLEGVSVPLGRLLEENLPEPVQEGPELQRVARDGGVRIVRERAERRPRLARVRQKESGVDRRRRRVAIV